MCRTSASGTGRESRRTSLNLNRGEERRGERERRGNPKPKTVPSCVVLIKSEAAAHFYFSF